MFSDFHVFFFVPLVFLEQDFVPHGAAMFTAGALLGPALDGVSHGNFGVSRQRVKRPGGWKIPSFPCLVQLTCSDHFLSIFEMFFVGVL